MAHIPSAGAPKTDFRDLQETLTSYQQEVQQSELRLKKTYDLLDEQAVQDMRECMKRYQLNSALLAQIFQGPGPISVPPLGGSTVVSKGPSDQGNGKACEKEDVSESPKSPVLFVLPVTLKRLQHVGGVVRSSPGKEPSLLAKHVRTEIAPGVHRVELVDSEEDPFDGEVEGDAIVL